MYLDVLKVDHISAIVNRTYVYLRIPTPNPSKYRVFLSPNDYSAHAFPALCMEKWF